MANETVSIRIKAFDQTQKALRGIQAAFGRLSKVFFSFKTALAGAVGAGGFGLLVANSLKATDALAKTAGRIGTTTEALSKLQFAGSLTGIETNTIIWPYSVLCAVLLRRQRVQVRLLQHYVS